ncbi:MAG: ABC transporter permease, partial [Vicinamibacterales bacterium]
VDGAAAFGAVFMSFFIVLGLFSVAAGILLIFLIFMMLAAERRSEMGMARAVGMKRSHLVQNFIAEGTAYDLGAALVGAAIGVLVAFAIAGVMGALIGEFFTIRPHATFRSLLVAYSLGVAVTFLTIIFASVRASRLNIVAAIRDLPDVSSPHAHERPHWRWWSKLPRFAGIASTIVWFPLELIWNVLLVPLKLIVWLLRLLAHYVGWGPFLTLLGALMMLGGTSAKSVFQFSVGLTLGSVGLAIFLARYLPKRLVYTIIAAINLAYYLVPFETLEFILPDLGTGGFEMFFVSGISMVTFATLIIMWNAEVVIAAISFLGRVSSRWLPAVKTAVAYPMAARGRTGMTVAMFSLVIFSLVALSTINANFAESAQTDAADAGWDIALGTSPSNPIDDPDLPLPIDDLKAALENSEVDTSRIAAVGRLSGLSYENTRLRNIDDDDEWKFYGTNSLDAAYVTDGELLLEARAPGYESDEAVWDAFR